MLMQIFTSIFLSKLLLLIGTNDPITYVLILMNVLFFLVVLTYFLITLDKRKKQHSRFIKGTWLRQGKTPQGIDWHINYVFTDKYFEIKAIPEYHVKGEYKIIKEVERLLVLQLFNVKSTTAKTPRQLKISVDPKQNRISIDDRVYIRTKSV